MNWLPFVLFASVVWTPSTFITSKIVKGHVNPYQVGFLYGLTCSLLFAFFPFTSFHGISFGQICLLQFVGALSIWMLLPYFVAYRYEHPEVMNPLIQTSAVFMLLFSWLFFDQFLEGKHIGGFILIFSGGILLSLRSLRKFEFSPAFVPAILSSLLIGLYYVFLKQAVSLFPSSPSSARDVFILSRPGCLLGVLLIWPVPAVRRAYTTLFSLPRKILWGIPALSLLWLAGIFSMFHAQGNFYSPGILKAVESSTTQVFILIASVLFVKTRDLRLRTVIPASLLVIGGTWLVMT